MSRDILAALLRRFLPRLGPLLGKAAALSVSRVRMVSRIKRLRPLIGRLADSRPVKPEAKRADPFYLTPEYRAWRETVISRAGRRCEDIDEATGQRCAKAEPRHRMFADHIIEVKDGGAPYDPINGKCRCGSHHTRKTAQARADRLRS